MFQALCFLSALLFIGCGGGGDADANASAEANATVEINTTVEVNNTVENNITIVINPTDTAYYGDGSYISPFLLMQANYEVNRGDTWFITPTLNQNCTIRVRTTVLITDIVAESREFAVLPIRHLSSRAFEFDVNGSEWATLNFYVTSDGYITTTGECLDAPKIYEIQ